MGHLNSGLFNQIEGIEQWLLSNQVYEKKKSHVWNFSISLAKKALKQNNSLWQLNLKDQRSRLFKLHWKDTLLHFQVLFHELNLPPLLEFWAST